MLRFQWIQQLMFMAGLEIPICSRKLINTRVQLGGPNKIVQVDESLFRLKPKHHKGRATSKEVWVFGMVDTSTSPSLGYMEIVLDRTCYPWDYSVL